MNTIIVESPVGPVSLEEIGKVLDLPIYAEESPTHLTQEASAGSTNYFGGDINV